MGAHRKNPPQGAAKTIEDLAAQGHAKVGIAKRLGVSSHTLARWCEEDETLQEAFDLGRETERQALHSLIVQAAVMNKGANANAMFLLKCRHGYREQDSAHTKVNVGVNVAPSVMIVHDFGSDAEWEARAAAQQAALVLDAGSSPILALETAATLIQPASATPTASHAPGAPSWDAPAWRGNA
jgi:hypothetical protein